ncbi:hypothetical protein HEP85_44790 [Streptomyces sp. RPA4-2]|uniref:hypothetical protein n=1 Tax=Streptomyces sp. RPA4-2 TaxID=2721244 RepID=UPI002001DE67|nr:hypothetical protein [Streptomyces sp. RPA4-2]
MFGFFLSYSWGNLTRAFLTRQAQACSHPVHHPGECSRPPNRRGRGIEHQAPRGVAVVARIQRLRTGLTYASIGPVLDLFDLFDRISLLDAALRGRGTRSETRPWT